MKFFRILKIVSIISLLFFINNSCLTQEQFIQKERSQIESEEGKFSIIRNISYKEEERFTRIILEGSKDIQPFLYKLVENPLRIVVDIPNIDLRNIKGPLKIENETIGEVTSTQYDDKGRIEIFLKKLANYNIIKEDDNLIIDVEKIIEVAKKDGIEEAKDKITEDKKKEDEIKEAKEVEVDIKEREIKEEAKIQAEEEKSLDLKKTEEFIEEKKDQTGEKEGEYLQPIKIAKEVLDLQLEESKDYITYNIIADGIIENYNYFKLESPPRLVLDILNTKIQYPKKSFIIKNPFIKEVRIGRHSDKIRFVFVSLKSKLPPFQIDQNDGKLTVSIGKVKERSEPQIIVQKSKEELGKASPQVGIDTSSTSKKTEPVKKVKQNILKRIDFREIDNKQRIVIGFLEEPEYELKVASNNIIDLEIKNAFIPKHLLRGLDTSEFLGVVKYIDLKNIKSAKINDVKISIILKEMAPYESQKEGNTIFVDIEKPKLIKEEAKPLVEKKEIPVETPKGEEIKKEEVEKEEKVELQEKKKEEVLEPKKTEEKKIETKPLEEAPKEKVYTGRRLSLDFKDADIKNILRLIAEVSNLNIIAGDDVTGKITMRLVDVPWDQALDVILQARGLGMTRVGNVIRVAPMETLKREVQAELEARRAKEKLEDLVTELIPVNYASAKEISAQVKSVLSERGDVKVDERTNILIVKDIPKNIPNVKILVKSLDTKTPQVLIEARIVEANLTFQEELGVKWGFLAVKGEGEKKTTYVGGGTSGSTSIGGTTTSTDYVVNLPAVAQGGVPGTTGTPGILELLFTSKYGLRELDIAISAHENKGDVKVISSPKIATLNNREASIEQGLRIPYRKLTTEGTVTTDFIDANLKLTVIPHVTNDGNIRMTIKAKKDAPDTSITVDGVPSIDKKEAITEVLVKDNGVVVIAGVYSIEKNENVEGVPLFSKIPILGWLFKRETKQDKRKDLLIFISPKIIKDQV